MNNKLNCVVVEDDLILSMVLERMLEKLDFDILKKCDNGQCAINTTIKLRPDLVLMDIQLKDSIDGISAMQEIRKTFNVPVIYITGNSDDKNVERAEETIFSDYLTKPVQINELKKSILKVFPHRELSFSEDSTL